MAYGFGSEAGSTRLTTGFSKGTTAGSGPSTTGFAGWAACPHTISTDVHKIVTIAENFLIQSDFILPFEMSEILTVINQDKRVHWQSSRRLGELGEQMAADFLIRQGFRLVAANFKVPVGRNSRGVQVNGEIDLIALENDTLCFTEVKTRRSAEFAEPLSAVGLRKQRQITRTARIYRRIFGLKDIVFRFDVITVLLEKGEDPQIELIRGFWSEAKFRKKAWTGDI